MNQLDRAEYDVKLDQIKTMLGEQDYEGALAIAKTIDWRRVKSVKTLCMVADIFEVNDMLEDSKDILLLAYKRSSIGKMILYRLVEVCLKLGDIDEAVNYYGEYSQAAAGDSSSYVLKYKIFQAKGASVEDQIAVLEEYREIEFTEHWTYELARLYDKAGLEEKCVKTCDDLILWFSEGKYITRAMELKMKYEPLTPEQQEKYDNRDKSEDLIPEEQSITVRKNERALKKLDKAGATIRKNEELARIAAEESAKKTEDEPDEGSESILARETSEESLDDPDDTQPIAEEEIENSLEERIAADIRRSMEPEKLKEKLATSIRDVFSGLTKGKEEILSEIESKKEEELAPLPEEAIDISTVKSLEPEIFVKKSVYHTEDLEKLREEEAQAEKKAAEEAANQKDTGIIQELLEETANDLLKEIEAKDKVADTIESQAEEAAAEVIAIAPTEEGAEIEEDMEIEEVKEELEPEESIEEIEEVLQPEDEQIREDLEATKEIETALESDEITEEDEELTESEETEEEVKESPETEAVEEIEDVSEIEEVVESEETPEEELTVVESDETEIKVEDEKRPEEIETAPKCDETTEEVEEISEAEAVEEAEDVSESEKPDENTEAESVVEALQPEDEQIGEGLEATEEIGTVSESGEKLEITEEVIEELEPKEPSEESTEESVDEVEESPEEETVEEAEEVSEIEEVVESEETPAEEPPVVESDETEEKVEDEESPAEEVEEESKASVTPYDSPEMRLLLMAVAEMEEIEARRDVSVSTSDLPEKQEAEEADDVIKEPETSAEAETETEKDLLIDRLTEDQIRVFTYFTTVPGMEEQILHAMNSVYGNAANRTSSEGNIAIMGNEGSGKTQLMNGLVKTISSGLGLKKVKTAKITGAEMNSKDPARVVSIMAGGFLMIEQAGSMNDATIETFSKALDFRTDGLVVLIEDNKQQMRKLLAEHEEFARKFASVISIPVFTNDELIAFAKTYAEENGYRIDNMGVLALYTKISENQSENKPMTVGSVRELIDKAILRVHKGKPNKKVSGRRIAEDGRIIIHEKDFDF